MPGPRSRGIVAHIGSEPTIGERLERIEEDELVVWELRRALGERIEEIRRGAGVFDAVAREQYAELKRREAVLRVERSVVAELVEEATAAVTRRRPPKPTLERERAVAPPVRGV